MRESLIAGGAGLFVVTAAAALGAALVTWEPSVVTPASAHHHVAALPVEANPPPQVTATLDLPEPDLPAAVADLSVPAAGTPSIDESLLAASYGPASPFTPLVATGDPVTAFLAVDPPRTAPSPVVETVREIVRRDAASRNVVLAARTILPPPRPAFTDVPSAPAALIEIQPAATVWPETARLTVPSWENSTSGWGTVETPSTHPERTLQSGMASWYGPGFHGRRTASGEVFNQNALTAAHRHLPFGTKVRVVDQKTGRSVIVRINDRGPFSHGRVIDLSRASAEALGMSGTSRVKIVSAE